MAAYSINLLVEKNSDFSTDITIADEDTGSPLNLSGFTANAKIKRSYSASTSQNFNVEFVDRIGGVIRLFLTSQQTSELSYKRYVYDVVIESPSNIKTRVVEGLIEVSPGVT